MRTSTRASARTSAWALAWTLASIAPALGAAPGLAELYEKALKNDAVFHAREARYQAESLAPGIARAPLLPQISLTARRERVVDEEIRGRSFELSSEGPRNFAYDSERFGVNLTQTLFNLGNYIALKQSKSQAERAGVELEAAHQDLILRLAEAYFGVLVAEETLKFARAEKEAVGRQLEQAQERFAVGLASISDVQETKASYDLAEAEEIRAENLLQNAFHALAVITDYDAPALQHLTEDIPVVNPEPNDVEAWVARALSQNLDLLAQQITTNVAEQEIRLQRAGHYPSLDLFASQNRNEFRRGTPTERDVESYTVGVELNVPIFSGQGTRYRTKQAAELHRESLEQLKGVQRETKRAAREAYLNVIASVSRVKALSQAEESAETALDASRAGLQVGTRTSVDVLLALKDLFRIRRDYADVRYEYLLNTLRLKKVAGMLAERDVRQLDGYLRDAP